MQRDPDGHCLYRLRVNGDQGCDEQTMDPSRLQLAGTEPVFALQKVQAIYRLATFGEGDMRRFLLDAIDSDRPRCRRIFGGEHLVGGQELEDRHVDGDPEILDPLLHIQVVVGLQVAEQLDACGARSVKMGSSGTPASAASIGTSAVIDISPRIEEHRKPPAPSRIC